MPCCMVNPAQKEKAVLEVPPSQLPGERGRVGVSLASTWRQGKGVSAGCCGNRNSGCFASRLWLFAFDVVFTSQFGLNFVPSFRCRFPEEEIPLHLHKAEAELA